MRRAARVRINVVCFPYLLAASNGNYLRLMRVRTNRPRCGPPVAETPLARRTVGNGLPNERIVGKTIVEWEASPWVGDDGSHEPYVEALEIDRIKPSALDWSKRREACPRLGLREGIVYKRKQHA